MSDPLATVWANSPRRTDTLVLGGGLAGLYAALRAAEHGSVTVVTASSLRESSSYWAQGGLAAAVGVGDTPASHRDDTVRVGRGLCRHDAVDMLVDLAPAHLDRLMQLGVDFERIDGELDLGLEAGHSHRRIAHGGGGNTGRIIMDAVTRAVAHAPNIAVVEDTRSRGLLHHEGRCYGAFTDAGTFLAGNTVLATGGAASLYARTTNPRASRGEGIAQGWLAGAAVADMEFVQFHPTALVTGGPGDGYLLSEALRGEGAHLFNSAGERFMEGLHPDAELAPRDELARAIVAEMIRTGHASVYLSLAHLPAGAIRDRFATIGQRLSEVGYDLAADKLPVAPAAHYLVGGVLTDLQARTTVAGLTACGEVACTGVHGANRLASNSLLECLVFADHAGSQHEPVGDVPDAAMAAWPHYLQPQDVAQDLWRDAGLERDGDSLQRLAAWLPRGDEPATSDRIVAGLIATAALTREESRGSHYRSDFPELDAAWEHHVVLQRGSDPARVELAAAAVRPASQPGAHAGSA